MKGEVGSIAREGHKRTASFTSGNDSVICRGRRACDKMAASEPHKRKTSPMLREIVLSGAIALMATVAPDLADAQSAQGLAWCKGQGDPTPEQQIGGCSDVIESK